MSKRNDSIRISPRYGVNPTIPICFFCGKEKNEVALLGRIGDGRKGEDFEAPKYSIIDYVPCEDCAKSMANGITLIGVESTAPDERPPIAKGMYPTGSWVVVTEEFIERNINDESLVKSILKARKTLADSAIVDGLLAQLEQGD